MPNRILRDGILTSERVDKLSAEAEIFYRRLMSVVDDFGRFSSDPRLIRAACYPLRLDKVSDHTVSALLNEVKSVGLIVTYESAGKKCLQMIDFRQQMRAKVSKYPSPDEQALSKCVADAQHMKSFAHLGGGGGGDVVECESTLANAFTPPTLAQVKTFAEMRGIQNEVAEIWFNEMEGCGWLDNKSRPVVKWEPLLTSYSVKWRSNEHQRNLQREKYSPNNKPNPLNAVIGGDAAKRKAAIAARVARDNA